MTDAMLVAAAVLAFGLVVWLCDLAFDAIERIVIAIRLTDRAERRQSEDQP